MDNKFRHFLKDIYILETPAGGVYSGIIFVNGKEKVLIDSGENSDHIDKILVPALRDIGYELTDIDWLCNTHTHGDHIGGHHRIMELGHPKVATYWKSVQKLKEPKKYSAMIRATYPAYSPSTPDLKGVETDLVLDDGDMVASRLKVIPAPGHDDDCICLYDTKTKTLISGDSLQGNGTITQGMALYINLDIYRSTLNRLLKMDIENILPAHPYTYTGNEAVGELPSKLYINRCWQVTAIYEDFIKRRMEEGVTDTVKLAKQLIDYMGNRRATYLFLPLYTVDAHKQHLREAKKVF